MTYSYSVLDYIEMKSSWNNENYNPAALLLHENHVSFIPSYKTVVTHFSPPPLLKIIMLLKEYLMEEQMLLLASTKNVAASVKTFPKLFH